MKRILLWAAVTAAIAGITFSVGAKMATDRYKGDNCSEWIQAALRDAKLEGDAYAPKDRFNVEMTAFLNSIDYGIFWEGRDFFEEKKGKARVAPYKICSFDNSDTWKKYGRPRAG